MEKKLLYNTQRKRLPMPEYGRSIQNLVDYAVTLEDRQRRQRCAEAIVKLMANMFPQWRDVQDFTHKLWDHLAFMSDYKLDIDYPVEIVKQQTAMERPNRLSYHKNPIRYRHYGSALERFITSLATYPEGEAKQQLISLVANHMKRSMMQWNPTVASDKKVVDDLENMTAGRVCLTEGELSDMTSQLSALPEKSRMQKPAMKKQKAKRKK